VSDYNITIPVLILYKTKLQQQQNNYISCNYQVFIMLAMHNIEEYNLYLKRT